MWSNSERRKGLLLHMWSSHGIYSISRAPYVDTFIYIAISMHLLFLAICVKYVCVDTVRRKIGKK